MGEHVWQVALAPVAADLAGEVCVRFSLELERKVLNDVAPFFGGGNGRNQQNIINRLANGDGGFHHERANSRFRNS